MQQETDEEHQIPDYSKIVAEQYYALDDGNDLASQPYASKKQGSAKNQSSKSN